MGLEEIIKFVSKYLEAGELKSLMLILLIAVPVYIMFNLSRVFDSFDSFRKRKQAIIRDYFEKDFPKDPNTEKVILDVREARYFKSIVGIYAEERFRYALIKLHTDLSPSVDWSSIRKALRYLRARDGQIEVRFTLSAFIAYLFYIPLYFLVSAILLILIDQFIFQPIVFIQQLNKIAYVFVYSLLFVVLLREIWVINSAVRIWKKLNSGKTKFGLMKELLKARLASMLPNKKAQ
jgi:hypothetical protein